MGPRPVRTGIERRANVHTICEIMAAPLRILSRSETMEIHFHTILRTLTSVVCKKKICSSRVLRNSFVVQNM